MDRVKIHLKSRNGQYNLLAIEGSQMRINTRKHGTWLAPIDDFKSFVGQPVNFNPRHKDITLEMLGCLEGEHLQHQVQLAVVNLMRAIYTMREYPNRYRDQTDDINARKHFIRDISKLTPKHSTYDK